MFTLDGQELSSFIWNGSVVGITSTPVNSVVFGDVTQQRIYKRRMGPGATGFEWTADVKAPHGICVDNNGLIWIMSNTVDCLTILNKDGEYVN